MHSSEDVWRERGLRSAIIAGDERAWRTLYDESFAGLHAYVSWRCAGLRDLIDEAVQDTWLTAVRRIRSFDPSAGSFAAWLRGIAANGIRNLTRRWNRRRTQSLNGQAEMHAVAADGRRQHEQAECVARALAALPAHYEEILRAKYLDQLSVAQIATARSETCKTVEALLTRARQAFRDFYGANEFSS